MAFILTYTVQANPGYTVSFSTNVLFWHNSATGPINGELQYSTGRQQLCGYFDNDLYEQSCGGDHQHD